MTMKKNKISYKDTDISIDDYYRIVSNTLSLLENEVSEVYSISYKFNNNVSVEVVLDIFSTIEFYFKNKPQSLFNMPSWLFIENKKIDTFIWSKNGARHREDGCSFYANYKKFQKPTISYDLFGVEYKKQNYMLLML